MAGPLPVLVEGGVRGNVRGCRVGSGPQSRRGGERMKGVAWLGDAVRGEKVPDARGVWKELSRVKGELRRVKGGDVEDE